MTAVFHPPNAIVRGRKLTFLLKVDPCENDRCYAHKGEDDSKKARLQISGHRGRGMLGTTHLCQRTHGCIITVQLGCQPPSLRLYVKP